MTNTTAPRRHGSLGTGAVTAVALAVQTGLAAVVGVVIARTFGRDAETDGFLAAYGVFVVLALAATAIRVTVLPRFARARADGRLAGEVAAVGRAVGLVAVPLVVLCILARTPIAAALTGFGPEEARSTAAAALPWMVIAAAGQLAAGILASAFAALDDYVVPAVAYITGSVVGLVLILLRVDADGIIAVAWGVALNAALACSIPAALLALRARRERMPGGALRAAGGTTRERLAELGSGTALLLVLQLVYVVCLPLASRNGVGAVTSFGYAYLIGSAVVSVTASSLGLVTSVPLTRQGLDPEHVAHHVEASSWIALLAIGAAGGVFAVAGGAIVGPVLGSGYGADVGAELGNVVVAYVPWMVATVGIAVVFPLVFVGDRARRLPLIGLATFLVHVPLAVLGQVTLGLSGLALALAGSTLVALVLMLHLLQAVAVTMRRFWQAALVVGLVAVAAFLPAAIVLDGIPSAVAGLVLDVAFLALLRPRGLREGWAYLRALA